uniref:L-cysteine desulfidase family protein n=1 Tax=uncultured Flavonifractor sp. TaxID=1193534 RepID=UPI002622A48F|nr:L-serine ammonia-lyase, iron-sulfur-dependent, subunit alpha [uncultured Flavonifractor sp.]
MEKTDAKYQAYLQILREELVPAMGCTEPIALAYGAAVARRKLGCLPDTVSVQVSGNLVKNVKSVIVPNTGGLKGIPAAVTAGLVAGDPDRVLEVISVVTEEQKAEMAGFLQSHPIQVHLADTPLTFDYTVTLTGSGHTVTLRIVNYHTNVVLLEKDGLREIDLPVEGEQETALTDRSVLSIKDIVDFADSVDVDELRPMLDPQIQYNMAIAEEGLLHAYGSNVGKVLMSTEASLERRARAKAAAGSDARMNGCEMPVVIVSGSGNQGITASVPVIEYARSLGIPEERMYRALAVSDLCTIHQKTYIGRLSAFCGAVSAGAGAGAGICYLLGGRYDQVKHTIVNALAFHSGVVCDGAKSSCAAKISMAVEAGIFGYQMYQNGQQFHTGDGIISDTVEHTIQNVGELGRQGMRETDHVILDLMTREPC